MKQLIPDPVPEAKTQTHESTATTIISGRDTNAGQDLDLSNLQRESSHYLDKMFGGNKTTATNGNNNQLVTLSADVNYNEPRDTVVIEQPTPVEKSKKRGSIVNDLIVDPTILSPTEPDTPSHKKTGSTIQGGFRKFQQQLSEKIVSSLADAQEEREKILETVNQIATKMNEKEKKPKEKKRKSDNKDVVESINNMKADMREIDGKVQEYQDRTIKEIHALSERLNSVSDLRRGTIVASQAEDLWDVEEEKGNTKEVLQARIKELEKQIKSLKEDIKDKDGLIKTQALNIKELQMTQSQSNNMDIVKNEILQQIRLSMNNNQQSRNSAFLDDVKCFVCV